MKTIDIDASTWRRPRDVSDAILSALDAPVEYSRGSVDALLELMVLGEVGATEPPYTIRLSSTGGLPPDASRWLNWIVEGLAEYREDHKVRWGVDVEANLEILS